MFQFWSLLEYEASRAFENKIGDYYALPRQQQQTGLRRRLAAYEWPNFERRKQVCKLYDVARELTDFAVRDKYSIVIAVYEDDKTDHLTSLVRHYRKSSM